MTKMSDAKESMKMLLQIVETHSTEGAERSVELLIDLLNSTEAREFLNETFSIARRKIDSILSHLRRVSEYAKSTQNAVNQKLPELEDWLRSSLFESLKCMREILKLLEDRSTIDYEISEIRKLISNGDSLDVTAIADILLTPSSAFFVLTKASPILEDGSLSNREKIMKLWNGITDDTSGASFGATARGNMQNRGYGGKVLADFEEGVRRCNIGVNDSISYVHDNIRGLKDKLTEAQMCTVNSVGAPAVAFFGDFVGLDKAAGDARRFGKRLEDGWFDRTEKFIFDYIRGRLTDDELRDFIEKEELEADLDDIRNSLNGWISSTRSSVNTWIIPMEKWQIPRELPMINKEGVIAEVKRTWAFTKALLLEDKANIDLYSQLLNGAIRKACAAEDGVAPVISLGRMPDGGKQLQLRFVCGQNANISEIKRLVDRIADLTSGSSTVGNQLVSGKEVEFQVVFCENQEENVRCFMQQLVTKMAELAELHVRTAMLENFDISIGARLTNPAFNRTYGDGWSVPGFIPTRDFGFRHYSGEKYFCPKGWRRISINVASSAAEFDRKYGGWHVAYHGTKHQLSATILTSGFIPRPGAYSDHKDVVYFSPSIVYASHPRHSDVYQVTDSSGMIKYVQMVLQIRINPRRIWKKLGGTLLGAFPPDHCYYKADRDSTPADMNFPENKNLDWLVQPAAGKSGFDMFSDAFVVYGIMIRYSDTDPTTHPENAWWAKT